MKKVFLFIFTFIYLCFSAQDLKKIAEDITEEGMLLYKSEMASWYGSDVFLANYKEKEKIGGYFSYIDIDIPKCIFYSKDGKVLGQVSFPTNYNPENTKLDLKSREFTKLESEYHEIRQKAFFLVKMDTIFKSYQNRNFNIVPLITKNEKKVYILTGTNVNNQIIFGNDYLISFKKNEISKVEKLHQSIIVQTIVDEKVGKTIGGAHSHVLEDWQYITPTDICTLMLFQKFTNWESYSVVSKKYTSLWNCENNTLVISKN